MKYEDNIDHFIARHKGEDCTDEGFDFYINNHARDINYLIDEVPTQRFFDEDNLWFGIFESLHHFPGFEFSVISKTFFAKSLVPSPPSDQ